MSPKDITDKMMAKDSFSQWLGIDIVSIEKGKCEVRMTVRPEMCNGFGIAHGGISYSFSDSAFAFASNSQGRHAVSIETSISHTKAIQVGDILLAKAQCLNNGNRIAQYEVSVQNQHQEIVALFKGTVYVKSEDWV